MPEDDVTARGWCCPAAEAAAAAAAAAAARAGAGAGLVSAF